MKGTNRTNAQKLSFLFISDVHILQYPYRGHRGRDRMVVGFTTTYEISAYHH